MRVQSLTTRRKRPLIPAELLIILWLCFIVRGCFYSAILPLWEGYDEPGHFAFIQYVAAHHSLPKATTPVSRDVEASLHVIPLSWEQRLHALAPPIYTEDSYWQLPQWAREKLQGEFHAIPPAWGMEQGNGPAMYEAQQAPLYYGIMAVPLRPAEGWSLAGRVMLVRFLGVLIASLLVPIAWIAAREFFGSRAQAVGIVAVIVCMPELMINISRAGNESLAVAIYSLLTLLLLRAARAQTGKWFLPAGIVLGIGLLTKAYFLLAIPAFVIIAAYCAWRYAPSRGRILINGVMGLVVSALICGPWYWRIHLLTGSWSGEQNNAKAVHQGLGHLFASAAKVNWIGGMEAILVSHIWFGGWSFLKLPKPVYAVWAAGIALAVLGLAVGITKDRCRSPELSVVVTVYALFWVGMVYETLLIYVATGVSGSPGWYMYAVVLPEILLVAYGLYQLVARRWRWIILPALAAAFAAIDFYGVAALMAPYYTGLIRHVSGSDVVHGSLAALVQMPGTVLSRLTVNKPQSLNEPVLVLLAVLYIVATFCSVGLSFVALRSTPNGAGEPGPQNALSSIARI